MEHRRLRPRLWDTDWLMLRGITAALTEALDGIDLAGKQVLDFGCGQMPYRSVIEARGATYHGADFDETAMVRITPAGTLPLPDDSMDLVLSVQVLEHVADLDLYLGEIARVLRPGGHLLLSTHGTWLYHPHPQDHRRWTRTGLALDLQSRGFATGRMDSIVGPLATTTMIRLTGMAFFLRTIPLVGPVVTAGLAVVMNLRGWLEDRITPRAIRDDNGSVYMALCTGPKG